MEKITDISDKIVMNSENLCGIYTLESYCSSGFYRYRLMLSDTDNTVSEVETYNKKQSEYKASFEDNCGNILKWEWENIPNEIKKYSLGLLNEQNCVVYQTSGNIEEGSCDDEDRNFLLEINKNQISQDEIPNKYVLTFVDCFGRNITGSGNINFGGFSWESVCIDCQQSQGDYDFKFSAESDDVQISYVDVIIDNTTYKSEMICETQYRVSGYKIGKSFVNKTITFNVHSGNYEHDFKRTNVSYTYKNSYIDGFTISSFKKTGYSNFCVYMNWTAKEKSSHADVVFGSIVKTIKPSDGKYSLLLQLQIYQLQTIQYSICEYYSLDGSVLEAMSESTSFYVSQPYLITNDIPSDFNNDVVTDLTANRLSWDFNNKYGYLEAKQNIKTGSCSEILYTTGTTDATTKQYSNVTYVLKYTLPPFDLYDKMKLGGLKHIKMGDYYYDVYATNGVCFRERRFVINDVIYKRYDRITPDLFDVGDLTKEASYLPQVSITINNLSSYDYTRDDWFLSAEMSCTDFSQKNTGISCYIGNRDNSNIYDLYLTCTIDPTNYNIYLFHNLCGSLFYRNITSQFEEKTIGETTKNYCHYVIFKTTTKLNSLCVAGVGNNNRVCYATINV